MPILLFPFSLFPLFLSLSPMSYNPAMSSPELDADATAAAILCELSRSHTLMSPPRPTEAVAPMTGAVLTWPSVMKGKRSRRDAAVKERLLRFSPTSPLDLSGGSAASTSGSSSKVGYSGRHPLIARSLPPRSNGSNRSKKKMRRLPEVKEEVRTLEEENKSLKKEAEELRLACMVLKKENCNLEARSDFPVKINQVVGSSSSNRNLKSQGGEGFDLPDLNLPDLNLPPPVDFC